MDDFMFTIAGIVVFIFLLFILVGLNDNHK